MIEAIECVMEPKIATIIDLVITSWSCYNDRITVVFFFEGQLETVNSIDDKKIFTKVDIQILFIYTHTKKKKKRKPLPNS